MNTQEERIKRTKWSLDGLSVGDAFGESLFLQGFSRYSPRSLETMIEERIPPSSRWSFTDDTQMALSIVETMCQRGEIDQDFLAQSFAQRFEHKRGYGPAMYKLIPQLQYGRPWQDAARSLFNGQGSFGNGGAMRVAPVGAYFADDPDAVVENARRSAEVTHAHPEAGAGAIAVAVAAAQAWQLRGVETSPMGCDFLQLILPYVPNSQVKEGINKACLIPPDTDIWKVVLELGNGSGISAQDTVPFVLWCVSQHYYSYSETLWLTASGQGDIDTNCAIAGGIIACYTGTNGIPKDWLRSRESLPGWVFEETAGY